MTTILVVDVSVVVDLLARLRPQPPEALLWALGMVLAAPELIDIEVLNALRKLDQSGVIPPAPIRALHIRKYGHDNLLEDIWALRGRITAYGVCCACTTARRGPA